MNKAEKIASIVAIVELFKFYGTPHKLLPIFAIILGAALEYADNPSPEGIMDGLIMGAMTTGSYGVIKGASQTVLKKRKQEAVIDLDELDDDHSFKS